MPNIQNLRIGTRLGLSFAILLTLLVAMAAVGIQELAKVAKDTEMIAHDRLIKVNLAQTIENEVNRQSRAIRTALIANDKKVVAAELEKIEDSTPRVVDAVSRLQASVDTAEGQEALNRLNQARKVFEDHEHKLIDLIKANRIERGQAYLVEEMLKPQTDYILSVEALAETEKKEIEAFAVDAAENASLGQNIMLTIAVIAVVIALLVALLTMANLVG